MNLNLDTVKQAQKWGFPVTKQNKFYSPLVRSNVVVTQILSKKHLWSILGTQFMFEDHLKKVPRKINKSLVLLRKLQNVLPRAVFITIQKAFFRPHLECCGILEAVVRRHSFKKVFLKIFQNSQENTCARVPLCNFIKKEALSQVFSCGFCKIYRRPLADCLWNSEEKPHQELGSESL